MTSIETPLRTPIMKPTGKMSFLLILLCTPLTLANSFYDSYAIRIDSTRSNQGPLTTTFTPPSTCFTPTTQVYYGYPSIIQGCPGPAGNECCPQDWNWNVYFSPGVCPSGYRACTLPTTTQRRETTEICCPSNFACQGQDYCISSLPTISTMTYTDSTLSTESTVYAITATPIQIRFRAQDSTVVPIATDSLKLPMPRHGLDTREKVGIGIGVPAAVGLLGMFLFVGYRGYRRRRDRERKGVFEGFGVDLRGRDREGDGEREREVVTSQGQRDDSGGQLEQVQRQREREMEIQQSRREMENERDPPPAYEK